MGLLDILDAKFKFRNRFLNDNSFDGSAAKNITSRRFHERYQINNGDLCFLRHKEFGSFKILDISFMACYVELMNGSGFNPNDSVTDIELLFLNVSIPMKVNSLRRRRNGWVLEFSHKDEKDLLALNLILGPVRCGSTAIEIPMDPNRDISKLKYRKRYAGDGPFDLVVDRDEVGQIKFAMITQRILDVYSSVLWEDGAVITKKSIDSQGVGARMGQTVTPDMQLVFAAAASCLGMPFSDGPQVAKILNACLSKANL